MRDVVVGSRNSSGGISGGGDVVTMGTVTQGEIACDDASSYQSMVYCLQTLRWTL